MSGTIDEPLGRKDTWLEHLPCSQICHRQDSTRVLIGGKIYSQFCSDDFLALATDSRVKRAAHEALELEGLGASGTTYSAGRRLQHKRLETVLQKAFGANDCILFSSAFLAFASVFSNYANETDVVFCDSLCHPLIADASERFAGKVMMYSHLDIDFLERCFHLHSSSRRKLVVIESLFGNTGEIAPLKEIYELCASKNAQLLVDESYAFGVLGLLGNGGLEEAGLIGKEVITVLNFEHALAGYGAALVAPEKVCAAVREDSVHHFYSMSLPAYALSAVESAITLTQNESAKRIRLRASCNRVFTELMTMGYALSGTADSPIVLLDLDDNKTLIKFSLGLFERGILVAPQPNHNALNASTKLRITVNTAHSDEQLRVFLQSMNDVGKVLNLI